MWNPIVLYDEELVNDEIPERSVHRLLRQALREEAAPHAANCLDAETVAAWMDGALAADVLAAAESHAAGCARCQAVLSAMARTAPPVAARSWWPSSLTLRWLVPAAAAATAAALWIAVVPPGTRPDATGPSSEINRAAPLPAPLLTPPPSSGASPAPATRAYQKSPAPAIPPADERVASAPELERRKELDAVGKSEAEAPKMVEARRDNSETAKRSVKFADQAAKQEEFRSRATAAAPPLDAAASPPPVSPQVGAVLGYRSAVPLLREIVSPDPASRWRAAAAPGGIYHSADSGVTWTIQQTGTKAELIAGSSPARDVCWVVGRGGVVLLSTNGLTWQLRPFLEAIDLVAVSATDAKTATVTTADGRRFSTTDGGATWFSPLLQESPATPF